MAWLGLAGVRGRRWRASIHSSPASRPTQAGPELPGAASAASIGPPRSSVLSVSAVRPLCGSSGSTCAPASAPGRLSCSAAELVASSAAAPSGGTGKASAGAAAVASSLSAASVASVPCFFFFFLYAQIHSQSPPHTT